MGYACLNLEKPESLSLCNWRGVVLALSQVITGLRNCSEKAMVLISSMCRHSALWVVCLCDRGFMHICKFFFFLHVPAFSHSILLATGWWGSKQGYLCCHDNREATPCFLHPTPSTCSVQNKAVEGGAGLVVQAPRFNRSREKTNKNHHPTVVDRSKLSTTPFLLYSVSNGLIGYIFFFLAQKAGLHFWNVEFTVCGNHFWSVNILLKIPY